MELISAKLIDGDGLDPTDKQVQEWAEDWLNETRFRVTDNRVGA